MIDKQIIIDGCDVSECKYYKEYSNPNEDSDEYNDICECSITESAFCFDECNSNCYYKQKEKYKNALKEIKEIAEPFCNACQEFEPQKNCRNCEYWNYNDIIQKISECEVE